MSEKIVFSAFADLHYKKGMYAVSVDDLKNIFQRAEDNNAELVINLGDMCNDYIRSPELIKAYLQNEQGLDVFGVYGNHELETEGNTMSLVTPLLTNRSDDVKWGSENGKIGNGEIAYYSFDKGIFRFVCLDANYSLNPKTGEYEHNLPASWGAPNGNIYPCSLGETQFSWLEQTLYASAKEGKHCIIVSHPSFSGLWQECNDAQRVRDIFRKANEITPKTVVLALNGHLHSNHHAVIEDVVYLDINTVRGGWWSSRPFYPYVEKDIKNPKYTFEFTEYDQSGNPSQTFHRPLSSLTMGEQTLFFKDPLSAIISVNEDGTVNLKGMQTEWMYGIAPDTKDSDVLLRISDFSSKYRE